MKDLKIGKRYSLYNEYTGTLVGIDGDDLFFDIDQENSFITQDEDEIFPGSVGIEYFPQMLLEEL